MQVSTAMLFEWPQFRAHRAGMGCATCSALLTSSRYKQHACCTCLTIHLLRVCGCCALHLHVLLLLLCSLLLLLMLPDAAHIMLSSPAGDCYAFRLYS
jgi:hypothetical protein